MGLFDKFGFSFRKTKEEKKQEKNKSFVQPTPNDGSIVVEGVGSFGLSTFDITGNLRSEIDLINKYREMELQPEVNRAIDDIVNEAIVIDEEDPVKINLDDVELSESLKEKIREEFKTCLKLLDFNNQGYDIFRRFYVDGRLYFHSLIDEKHKSKGLQELRYIDPRQAKKVIETEKEVDPKTGVEYEVITDEYWIYTKRNIRDTRRGSFGSTFFPVHSTNMSNTNNLFGVKIHPDSIVNVSSGRVNENNSIVLSHLHPAIKVYNQLRMMEDAVVIYRMTRAPERRIFYIDTGGLPESKAKEYLRSVMESYNNRMVYDVTTGEMRDDRRSLAMTEDFWLPRREGSSGTEITTLPGGQNLDAIEDIIYFQKKLYDALNVPRSRLDSDSGFNMGRSSEITNEELRFYKFIKRLRKRFTGLFDSILEKQLILKGITSKEDWQNIREKIKYDFNTDSYFTELKEFEILSTKIDMMDRLDDKVGKYFSKRYVQKNILKLSDDEIEMLEKEMEKEKKNNEIINNDEENEEF